MLEELRKFVAPEIITGKDSRMLIGQYAHNLGISKLLLVTDKNLQIYGWFKDIIDSLIDQNIDYIIYDDVTVNPKDYECIKGSEFYKNEGCQSILAVGGGSVIDCAKGISICISNEGSIRNYEGIDEIFFQIPPLLCISTTSGSAADISQFSIVTNTEYRYKMAIVSKMIVPDVALIDPVVTLTKSFDLTVDTGLDVLAHGIEAYVSNASSPITDLHAEKAIRLIFKYLPQLLKDLDDLKLRGYIMDACLHAGFAFSNASLGLVHAMAHAVGGYGDLNHGELNGILLEKVIRFNYDSAEERYNQIQRFYEEETGSMKEGQRLCDTIRMFVDSIRPNRSLNVMGIESSKFEYMSTYVLNDPCIVTNPKEVTKEDVVRLYEQIF